MYRYPEHTPRPFNMPTCAGASTSRSSGAARRAARPTSRFLGALAGIGVFLSVGMAAPKPAAGVEVAGASVASSVEALQEATDAVASPALPYTHVVPRKPGCDDLAALEPMALLGKLTEGQTRCLQQAIATAGEDTDSAAISLLLIANAYAQADATTWERLVHRHLVEFDGSNPDLAYAYALHLSRKGAPRAHGAIHWAEVALEHRTAWTRDTYQSRVNTLQRVRAEAARDLWLAAEAAHVTTPTEGSGDLVAYRRSRADEFARSWLQHARAAGQDTTRAMNLCRSAAGSEARCSVL